MKKTFAVIVAAMMLVVALAGCGKKAEEPVTSPTVSEEPQVSEAPATSEEPTTSEAPAESPAADATTNG